MVKKVWIGKRRILNYKRFWNDAILVLVIPKGENFYAETIKNIEPKEECDVTMEFKKFEDIFDRVDETDLVHFKRKALKIMNENRLALTKNESKPKQRVPFTEIRRKHSRAYKKWSLEEDTSLKTKFKEGVSISEIATIHKRQIGSIRSRLKKLGLISE